MIYSTRAAIFLYLVVLVAKDAAAGSRSKRVVGGSYVAANQVPKYVVRLKILNEAGTELRCGGTIISPRHVLTAGHCLYGRDNVTVYSGTREADDSLAVRSEYSTLIPHPRFKDSGKITVENDVGIVELKQDLNLTDARHEVSELASESLPEDGANVTFYGWGLTSDVGFVKPTFLKTAVLVMASEGCPYPTIEAFCTKTPHASPCGGDSGSPLVYEGKIIGIHSGDSCKENEFAHHLSVYYHREWINSVIARGP